MNHRVAEADALCQGGDSNPYGFLHQILSLARLPIPPPRRMSQHATTTRPMVILRSVPTRIAPTKTATGKQGFLVNTTGNNTDDRAYALLYSTSICFCWGAIIVSSVRYPEDRPKNLRLKTHQLCQWVMWVSRENRTEG